jgi:MYXO-CTERM domain-containing protein
MERNFFRDLGASTALAMTSIAAIAVGAPSAASACGGFFCSSANPVNQAAEQIIFVENGDGTVTAVIQIMYEGPANQFAWVLPVPGVPDVAVSSDQALDTLKQFTNPSYQLIRTFSNGCGFANGGAASGAGGSAAPSVPDSDGGGVTVQASGAIGPYEYDIISVDPALADPADTAIEWLTANEYDVGSLGPDVLRPYLQEELNLIAFRLQKGNSSGSIRPVMLTYESALPSIPIRPTAVAANDDMGVMVWVLSDARAIPENYKALELNEALIDWFNPNNNYNEVVSRAADEAQGQGFVTEYAGATQALIDTGLSIFPDWQQQTWTDFMSQQHTDPVAMVQTAGQNWSGWDGFDDALLDAVVLPDTITFDDFKRCMRCYITTEGVVFDTTAYLTGLYEKVIKPMADTQALIESRPYITRLYTTMSADEMTVDPVFDFNPDLDDVSNVHTATQIIECVDGSPNGPWTVELAQGDRVKGTDQSVWPIEIDSMPAALKIIEFGTEGQGRVVLDNSSDVSDMMDDDDDMMSGGGSGGTGGSSPGGAGTGPSGGAQAGSGSGGDGDDDDAEPAPSVDADSDGACSTTGARPASTLAPMLLALAAIARRRRRHAA